MKILLVEDNRDKAQRVSTVLAKATADCEITVVRSFLSAVRELRSKQFDLLVLDLVIPTRDGGLPNIGGGAQVLSEITEGDDCMRPAHIVCLTADPDAAKLLREQNYHCIAHVVEYNSPGGEWRQKMKVTTEYVSKRLRQSLSSPEGYSVDIGIVTSAPQVELSAVLDLPVETVSEYNREDVLRYYKSTWEHSDGNNLSVVSCAAPTMGMTAASITASKLIFRWRPRIVVMTGIAAGTKKDQGFGDILVAEAAYDYGSGKIVEKQGKRLFVPAPSQLRIEAGLHATLQEWERAQMGVSELMSRWSGEIKRKPKLAVGILASGAAVVQSSSLVERIMQNSRKTVGLEMEAFGIFHAVHLSRAPHPLVLVAKSISDFADNEKSDDWQSFAAFTSAQFVYEFLRKSDVLRRV